MASVIRGSDNFDSLTGALIEINKNSTGYLKMGNGFIMQWGKSLTNITANGGVLTITLPIAFPNDAMYSNIAVVTVSANNQIFTPFVVANNTSTITITNNDVDSAITQIRWIAIGY
jgi:hypothetical protein